MDFQTYRGPYSVPALRKPLSLNTPLHLACRAAASFLLLFIKATNRVRFMATVYMRVSRMPARILRIVAVTGDADLKILYIPRILLSPWRLAENCTLKPACPGPQYRQSWRRAHTPMVASSFVKIYNSEKASLPKLLRQLQSSPLCRNKFSAKPAYSTSVTRPRLYKNQSRVSVNAQAAMNEAEQGGSARKVAQEMLDFINRSATQYHAVGDFMLCCSPIIRPNTKS